MTIRPHDHLTSISRMTFSTTVPTAHGTDNTASVGRKELYAKEGSECKGLVGRWG